MANFLLIASTNLYFLEDVTSQWIICKPKLRMKVLPFTYLYMAKLELCLIKIRLKARIKEEISALLVSTKINWDISNIRKQVVFTIYKSSKMIKYEI